MVKHIVPEPKQSQQGVNSGIKMTEERVSEFENGSVIYLKS